MFVSLFLATYGKDHETFIKTKIVSSNCSSFEFTVVCLFSSKDNNEIKWIQPDKVKNPKASSCNSLFLPGRKIMSGTNRYNSNIQTCITSIGHFIFLAIGILAYVCVPINCFWVMSNHFVQMFLIVEIIRNAQPICISVGSFAKNTIYQRHPISSQKQYKCWFRSIS